MDAARLGTGKQQPRTCRRRCSSAASSGSLLGTTGRSAEPPEGVGGLSAAASMLAGQAASMLAGHSASRAGHCSCVGQEGGGAQHLRLVQAAVAAAAGEGIRTPAPDRLGIHLRRFFTASAAHAASAGRVASGGRRPWAQGAGWQGFASSGGLQIAALWCSDTGACDRLRSGPVCRHFRARAAKTSDAWVFGRIQWALVDKRLISARAQLPP